VAQIKTLVGNGKLVFAAASNAGGYGQRPWPAKDPGVFCIHACNEYNHVNEDMNIKPLVGPDNFVVYGCDMESYWKENYRSISGTSFATPVAAAIAANVVCFARRWLPQEVAESFLRYTTMRILFRRHMTNDDRDGVYHNLMPWNKGLWDGQSSIEELKVKLEDIWRYGDVKQSHL
jgi:hypothetical protein